MPVPVTINFVPPDEPNIVALRIYEAPAETGPFVQVERTTAVGTSPGYITQYTTALASAALDWFAIAWENSAGEVSAMSVPIKGGTETWVGEIVKRVLERDSSLDERVVTQEAEAVIESLGIDPYSDAAGAQFRQLAGMTYLTMARSMIARVVTTSSTVNASSGTIGLVSWKNDASTASAVQKVQADVSSLIDIANSYLGISTSFVLQLEDIVGEIGLSSYDHSRLIGWVGLV
jgi:hypothetical protein